MKKKILLPVAMAILAISMFGGVASAAQPAVQGCVGETISALAGPFWGPGVSSFARFDEGPREVDPAGLGDEIQWLQAGNPTLIPSACIVPQ